MLVVRLSIITMMSRIKLLFQFVSNNIIKYTIYINIVALQNFIYIFQSSSSMNRYVYSVSSWLEKLITSMVANY